VTHQEELLEALGITPEEFELNKQGKLTDKQVEFLNDIYLPNETRCLIAIGVVLFTPIILYFFAQFSRSIGLTLGIVFVVVVAVLYIMDIRQTMGEIHHVEQHVLQSKEGTFKRTRIKMGGGRNRYYRRGLAMGNDKFHLPVHDKLYLVLKKDHRYRIYYVNQRILAIEDLEPEQPTSQS
jgi:hypothetical protein